MNTLFAYGRLSSVSIQSSSPIACSLAGEDHKIQTFYFPIFLYQNVSSVSLIHSDGASLRIDDNQLIRLFKELPVEEVYDYLTSLCPIEIQRKYPGNHINWWNQDKMFKMLRSAGFTKIFRSGFGQSFSAVLRDTSLFDNTEPAISLYVEAIK